MKSINRADFSLRLPLRCDTSVSLCESFCLSGGSFLLLNIQHLRSNYSKEMTDWINTQLSIPSMQIEIEVLHLPPHFRKAQWKTWYMHPFPLPIHFLWKDDSYITVSQNFEANTWQRSDIYIFSFTEQRKSGILQTSQNSLYFPCCLCSLCCYPLKAQYDPQTYHFVVIFNIKYPFRDYLMLLSVYSFLAYTVLAKCKTNWIFSELALQKKHLSASRPMLKHVKLIIARAALVKGIF